MSISFFGATKAVARLQTRRLLRGRKVKVAAAAVLAVVFAVALSVNLSLDGETAASEVIASGFGSGVRWGFFYMLLFVVPFILSAGAIAEEVEGRTFPYLAARPIPRTALTLGKLIPGVVISVLLIAVGVLLLHLLCHIREPAGLVRDFPAALRIAGAMSLLCFVYCSLCLFWGALIPDAAGIVSALHLVVLEFAPSLLPTFLRFASLNFHAQEVAGMERGGLMVATVPDIPGWVSPLVLVAFGVTLLVLSGLVVSLSEYRFSKA